MRVNKYLMPGLMLLALVATVAFAYGNDAWIVSGKQMIDSSQLTSEDEIRGWMTVQQVADGFAIPVGDLKTALNLPADIPPTMALKDLEGVVDDFEVTTVREAVAMLLASTDAADAALEDAAKDAADGAQATPTPSAPTPPITAPATTPTGATAATVDHSPAGDGAGTGPTPLPPGTVLAAADIKGRHTLGEIAQQARVSLDDLLAALDLPADTDAGQSVRDLVESGRVAEVDDVRNAVTALQAR